MKLEIRYVPTEALVPYARNAKQHPPEQISQIAGSLKEFGFINPVIVDKDRSIVAGHGRVLAAQKLGLTEVPTLSAEHLTAVQVKAFRLADNRIAQNGSWDDDLLKLELEELDNLGIDLEGLGFDLDELPSSHGTEGLTDPDDVPETPKDVWVKPGDLFELGSHRLLCGDSTKREDVDRLMAGEKADMVFTDPPYGIAYQDFTLGSIREVRAKPIEGDTVAFDPQHIFERFCEVQEMFLWGADYYAERIPNKNEGSWVVWDKRSNGEEHIGAMDKAIGSAFELCWSKAKHQRLIARVIRHLGAYQRFQDIGTVHPTMKPVDLVLWFFERFGQDDGLVWDGYLGSGSTLIACEKTGRRCYGMEIDPAYCQVILERWAKFTGKQWSKIES